MWAVDHGAALYFHHSWPNRGSDPARFAGQAFDASMHVLLDVADDLAPIHHDLAGKVDSALLDSVLAEVPDEWLPHKQPRGRTPAAPGSPVGLTDRGDSRYARPHEP